MSTSPNEDGRPTQGGAAQPVHVLNPISVTLTGTIPGTVEIANDVGAPVPVAGTVIVSDGTNNIGISTAGADGTDNTSNELKVSARIKGFNGTTWDRIRTGLVAVQTTFVGLLNTLPLLRYNATPPTLADGNVAPLQGDINGSLRVNAGGTTIKVLVTPTLTVAATYVANDYVGTSGVAMVFAGMARVNGGTGIIFSATVLDKALQSVAGELWLFDTAVTPPADSAAWSISDADMLHLVTVIPFSTYYASALNSVSPAKNVGDAYKCAAGDTQLYGCFVTRGAPTYANGDLTVVVKGLQD